jgi:hypothetical protein
MTNNIWQVEEAKFIQATQNVRIPDATLQDVPYIIPKNVTELNRIPESGGCYWIWTNEPVLHSLHKKPTPVAFDNGEIIYNGRANSDVRGRIKGHLFGQHNATWSAISLDIYFDPTPSHRKKALSLMGKVPYIKSKKILKRGNKKKGLLKGSAIDDYSPIRTKEDLDKIYLSDDERILLNRSSSNQIHFRNGIDITESKHVSFEFRVYFITGLSTLYIDFIEKKWRENGLPKLCSYSLGR